MSDWSEAPLPITTRSPESRSFRSVSAPMTSPLRSGLAVVELAVRSAMHELGAVLLEKVVALDRGHRGPEVDCGAGHQARFVGYRAKHFDTVLGPHPRNKAGGGVHPNQTRRRRRPAGPRPWLLHRLRHHAARRGLRTAHGRRGPPKGSRHRRAPRCLGDDAPWIWNLAGRHFPSATQIVDLFHAREHLHVLHLDVAGVLVGKGKAWIDERLAQVDDGDITGLATAFRDLDLADTQRADVDEQLAYFETNADWMRYRHFRDLGLFVGSGVVEAGCRWVIGQRLKQSGMRWTTRGATGIATLRCEHASTDGTKADSAFRPTKRAA